MCIRDRGMAGAAWATIAGQAATMLLTVFYLVKKKIGFAVPRGRQLAGFFGAILKVAAAPFGLCLLYTSGYARGNPGQLFGVHMHGTALLLFDLDLSYNNHGNLSIKAHSRRSRLSGSGIAVFLKGNQNRCTASCGPELFLFCLSLSCSIRQKRLRALVKLLAVNLF